jgi:hypothetical protein
MIRRTCTRVLLLLLLIAAPSRNLEAAPITFTATNAADAVVGEDLWSITYSIDGAGLDAGYGFSIFFDYQQYATITPRQAPTGWDILAFQPDLGLPSDGVYDAFAAGSGLLGGPFVLDVVWLGGAAGPGRQGYEFYSFIDDIYTTVTTGEISAVPEPSTLVLLTLGSAALLRRRRPRPADRRGRAPIEH